MALETAENPLWVPQGLVGKNVLLKNEVRKSEQWNASVSLRNTATIRGRGGVL